MQDRRGGLSGRPHQSTVLHRDVAFRDLARELGGKKAPTCFRTMGERLHIRERKYLRSA